MTQVIFEKALLSLFIPLFSSFLCFIFCFVRQHVIGTGEAGFQDGKSTAAKFFSPQGVECDETNIYVADTGNHALRQINFEGDHVKVTTISGTGRQGTDITGGKTYTDQELSSPWGLVLSKTPDGQSCCQLVLALCDKKRKG